MEPVINCAQCHCSENCIYSKVKAADQSILNKNKLYRAKKAQSVLFEEGMHTVGIFVIREGRVKFTRRDGWNDPLVVSTAGCCSMIGMEALRAKSLYENSAVCVTDVAYCIIHRDTILEVLKNNFFAGEFLMEQFNRHITDLNNRINELINNDVYARVARVIIELHEFYSRKGKDIIVKKEELSDIAATTRETTSRIISDFKNKGVISTEGKTITVINPEALKKIAKMK